MRKNINKTGDPRRAKVHVPAVATPRNSNVSVEGDNLPPRLPGGFQALAGLRLAITFAGWSPYAKGGEQTRNPTALTTAFLHVTRIWSTSESGRRTGSSERIRNEFPSVLRLNRSN